MIASLVSVLLLSIPGIEWQPSLERAASIAADQERVVFCALHAMGEARSEEFLGKTYRDKRVALLAEETVNVVGAIAATASAGRRSPIKDLEWDQLRSVEASLREAVVIANEGGVIALPQHLWLAPDGTILLSVPYEMTADELAWCFAEASARAGKPVERPEGARPPRRLVLGAAYTPAGQDTLGRGLTPDELEGELKSLKAGWGGGGSGGGWGGRITSMLRVLFTDEEGAREYAEIELGNGLLRWGGNDIVRRSVHSLGLLSPPSFADAIGKFAGDNDPAVRREAAVAFEQLGTSDAYKLVQRAYSKEKEDELRPAWLRALAATGYSEKSVRKKVLSASEDEDRHLALNAIFALGHLERHEDVRIRLQDALRSGSVDQRVAAACAAALAREPAYRPLVAGALEATEDEGPKAEIQAALDVLDGANLYAIESAVRRVCRDEIDRERLFFRPVGRGVGGR